MPLPGWSRETDPARNQKHSHAFFRLLCARLYEPRSAAAPPNLTSFYVFPGSAAKLGHAQSRIDRQKKLPARLLPGGDRATPR